MKSTPVRELARAASRSRRLSCAHHLHPLAGALALSALLIGCRGPKVDEAAAAPRAEAKVEKFTGAATLPTDRAFNAVWGIDDHVWVAGQGGLLARLEGQTWQLYPNVTQQSLRAIHGTSKTDVWVVGENTILHWDGSSWSVPIQGAEETFIDVFASAPNRVWVVGNGHNMDRGIVRQWDGEKWQIIPSPHALSLWTAWASSPTDLWVAGTATGGKGIVLRGETPKFSSPGWDGASVRSIWGRASDDVWVAGYQGGLKHWNGATWSAPPIPDDVRLMSVSGSASDDVWAAGLKGTALHWKGQRWEATDTGTEHNLMAIWAGDERDVWAVGSEGTLLRWNGERWSPAPR